MRFPDHVLAMQDRIPGRGLRDRADPLSGDARSGEIRSTRIRDGSTRKVPSTGERRASRRRSVRSANRDVPFRTRGPGAAVAPRFPRSRNARLPSAASRFATSTGRTERSGVNLFSVSGGSRPPDFEEFARSRLALGAGELWERGTRARFLDAVGDGTLPEEAFSRWLAQDHRFVEDLARFVAQTIARGPIDGRSVLVRGLAALDAELDWFASHARERDLDLDIPTHPTCRRYTDYLISAAYSRPPEVLLAILYGVEVAYTVAWGRIEATGPYAEFIERWTHPDFRIYVDELRALADAHPHPEQQNHFDRVLRHEEAFWRMTWEG